TPAYDDAVNAARNTQRRQEQEDYERFQRNGQSSANGSSASIESIRARLLKEPPVPAARNPLLGSWRPIKGAGAQDDPFGLSAAFRNTTCDMLFGGGAVQFGPTSWTSGGQAMGGVQYRANNGYVFVFPDRGVRMLSFKVLPDGRLQN